MAVGAGGRGGGGKLPEGGATGDVLEGSKFVFLSLAVRLQVGGERPRPHLPEKHSKRKEICAPPYPGWGARATLTVRDIGVTPSDLGGHVIYSPLNGLALLIRLQHI